jgi:hypothetical protein
MATNFTKWFPSGFRTILGDALNKWFNNPQYSWEDDVVAHAGGGQTAAYPITCATTRVVTVASGADSLRLPPVSQWAGGEYTVINDAAANAAAIFPAVGDKIDKAAANASVTLSAGNRVTFFGTKALTISSFGGGKSS